MRGDGLLHRNLLSADLRSLQPVGGSETWPGRRPAVGNGLFVFALPD